ncbi:MAG: UbiA family prenyltransferase [Planctomycetota bacterium]
MTRALFEAARPQQWVKNLLVFVPLLAHHGPFDRAHLGAALASFGVFGLAASAGYLLNDVLDLEHDRRHPARRHRPLASGRLLPAPALAAAGVLVLASTALAALTLPGRFGLFLGAYVLGSALYSLVLKRVVVLDVLVLSALYTVRLGAGGAATATWVSPWLLVFSGFLFLGLAFLKRAVEIRDVGGAEEADARLPGRGWVPSDRPFLEAVGSTAGYVAVLVLALYASSAQVRALYERPAVLWLAAPALLYWQTRVWLLARRGLVRGDPVVFALRDPASYATAGWILACAVVAGPR